MNARFNSDALSALMRDCGIGPHELAKRAGISRSTLWAVLAAHRTPHTATVARIAGAFSIPPAVFWETP